MPYPNNLTAKQYHDLDERTRAKLRYEKHLAKRIKYGGKPPATVEPPKPEPEVKPLAGGYLGIIR